MVARTFATLVMVLIASNVLADDLMESLQQSDNFKKYKAAFLVAGKKLVADGTCSIADFKEVGGFVKSMNHKSKPIYFTYCGGMTIPNRLYLNAATGEIFR